MGDPGHLVGLIGYAVCAVTYLCLAVFLLRDWRRQLRDTLLLAACIATSVWAAVGTFEFWSAGNLSGFTNFVDLLRLISWVAFLGSLLNFQLGRRLRGSSVRYTVITTTALALGYFAYEISVPVASTAELRLQFIVRLLLVIAGLALIEVLLRSTTQEERWSVKFLCLALGGMLAYDLFLYSDGVLFVGIDSRFAQARGFVFALAAPLLAIAARRSQRWKSGFTISRRAALYTTTLIGSGLYICVMAAAALYLRELGGRWGLVVQFIFLLLALVFLGILVLSGTIRAYLKFQIGKHFYAYKYDYREEWARFTRTISEGSQSVPLETRVIMAIADIVESPAGALWLTQPNHYSIAATWNMPAHTLSGCAVHSMARFLLQTGWIVDLGEAREDPKSYPGLVVPEEFSTNRDAWVIVPLIHRSELIAFVLLARPRAPRPLDWEDYDLLKATARQAASYLAEHLAARTLAEARELEKFNRRFAFVVHDMKNLVSQLSLITSNFERFGDVKEFRDDMVASLRNAGGKMTRVMERLHIEDDARTGNARVRLIPLLESVVAAQVNRRVELSVNEAVGEPAVFADADRLTAVIGHLVNNAIEAVGDRGWVRVGLSTRDKLAVIEVTDNGPGMDSDFVRDQLFEPFRSTKKQGLGIGAFQCREFARELSGDLEVISDPASGTTMRLTLPLADGA